MKKKPDKQPDRRQELRKEIARLADVAIFGSISETYRKCGTPGCRCHTTGPKHGPHMYISYRGDVGKTTGYYVPQVAQQDFRNGVTAWQTLQQRLRELAELTREEILTHARQRREE